MPRRPDPLVPRAALQPGIAKCLEVSGWRLREAAGLLGADSAPVVTAAIFFTFGIEEFGKAALLRGAFETGQAEIRITGFYDHEVKIEKAAEHIPEEYLLLHRGAFQRGVFSKSVFDVGNSADLDARLAGLFVAWSAGEWRVGVRVDPKVLSANIQKVAGIVEMKLVEWVSG
jgi:hypothetical protein